jgi:hypothetical protein
LEEFGDEGIASTGEFGHRPLETQIDELVFEMCELTKGEISVIVQVALGLSIKKPARRQVKNCAENHKNSVKAC